MEKHTPVPWRVGYERMDGYNFCKIVALSHKNAKKERYIATVDISNDKSNATFIVRAVNAHEALVEAVKAAQQLSDWIAAKISTIEYKMEELGESKPKELEEMFDSLRDGLQASYHGQFEEALKLVGGK